MTSVGEWKERRWRDEVEVWGWREMDGESWEGEGGEEVQRWNGDNRDKQREKRRGGKVNVGER